MAYYYPTFSAHTKIWWYIRRKFTYLYMSSTKYTTILKVHSRYWTEDTNGGCRIAVTFTTHTLCVLADHLHEWHSYLAACWLPQPQAAYAKLRSAYTRQKVQKVRQQAGVSPLQAVSRHANEGYTAMAAVTQHPPFVFSVNCLAWMYSTAMCAQ